MNPIEHNFTPFLRLAIPVFEDKTPEAALALARSLGKRVQLIGIVCMAADESLTAGTAAARRLRKTMEALRADLGLPGQNRVLVSHHAWQDLTAQLQQDTPDLLLLDWPQHFKCLDVPADEILRGAPCQLALVRGPWPKQIGRILVPVRGGPNAELALRLAMAIPRQELVALHLSRPGSVHSAEAPLRGLEQILPSLKEVIYQVVPASDPGQMLLEQAASADLLLMGASLNQTGTTGGAFVERMLCQAPCGVVVLKAERPFPTQWTGPEGERTGAQAISLLVDRWFAENTYHAAEFDDLEKLLRLKREQGVTVSLALPALNEEETVGEVITTIRRALYEQTPLLDEIVLMDSNSSDRTREIARELGVPVHIHQEMLPELGARSGKGEALWKSLLATHGDIILWIDTDIVNIHPRFVYGVLGPLLVNPGLQFVKGFYQRPLHTAEKVQPGAGGRVTELTARPLLNLFYPELSGVIQPLSGEYGGRRTALEQCPFFSGYGVEIGLLIDIFERYGLEALAQVDLLERVHHNQSLEALSKMSFTILQAVIRKLERRYGGNLAQEVNKSMKLIRFEEGSYFLEVQEVVERERPPMVEVEPYALQRGLPVVKLAK
jgi:glycosyltransferase involved in cell wall biosynthesis/nucleotide-binding universal stress UspA family protein